MNPFIPINKPRYAIIDYRADEKIIETIKEYDITPIKTIKCEDLLEPVCGHPDMVIHPIDYEHIVVAPNVYNYYYQMFRNSGIKVIKGGKTLKRNYPNDIAYNVARIGKYAIHNVKYTDEVLKYYLQKSDIKFIHVNQGYSKCSTATLSDDRVITSDVTIYNTIKELGFKCFYFNPQNISLKGFDYGFIGGCIGALTKDLFLLTGKISNENDRSLLYDFICDSGYKILEATSNNITDLGTIIVI